jgi:hypothetical protein
MIKKNLFWEEIGAEIWYKWLIKPGEEFCKCKNYQKDLIRIKIPFNPVERLNYLGTKPERGGEAELWDR